MWSFTITMLACAGLLVSIGLCFLTVPYLIFGIFEYPLLGLEVTPAVAFTALVSFRYLRFLIGMVSYVLYRPAPRSNKPRFTAEDVTIICPTIEPGGDIFRRCCERVCFNKPKAFFIVVGRQELTEKAEAVCAGLRLRYNSVDIQVRCAPAPGKRIQIDSVIDDISTKITYFIDDHVYWPISNPKSFFDSTLAPFEDDNIYLVGTNKRVVIEPYQSLWKTFWNFIGAVYLVRHNFETLASTWIDGGIFAVSGRTLATRTKVLHNAEFRRRYLNETFGLTCISFIWGPLSADDDNMLTRWVFENGYGVYIQSEKDSLVETTLGWWPKHILTSLRWSRTTMRSNPRSLLMATTWTRQPWSIYSVYVSGMVNYALLFDPAIIYLYRKARFSSGWHGTWLVIFVILATKLVKLLPHFRQHPSHIFFFPGYVLFAYGHSLIKAWSLVTFWDIAWSGRKVEEIRGKNEQKES